MGWGHGLAYCLALTGRRPNFLSAQQLTLQVIRRCVSPPEDSDSLSPPISEASPDTQPLKATRKSENALIGHPPLSSTNSGRIMRYHLQQSIIHQVGAMLAICLTMLITGCDKKENAALSDTSAQSDSQGTSVGNSGKNSKKVRTKTKGRIEKPESEQALRKFASDFENLAGQNRDPNTLAKQRDLALAALPKIGGGEELLKFLNYLTERGAGDLRKELIEKHLGAVFTGPHAEEAREWLLTVEDEKLREALSLQAGKVFSGAGFKDYFEKMGEYGGLHSQASLLSGYCQTLAASDPEAAVKAYKELGYPKRIDNTGLAAVFEAMPSNTDFVKFATGIGVDTMTLAKLSRSALLRNWAGVKPEEAAQYILSNVNSGVAPDQMAQVVSVWANRSPESAANWIAKAPEGKAKDEGCAALARFWSASDPIKAWDNAARVGDFNKRVETATAVFKEWEKTDRAAAEKAWVELFPGK